MAFFFLVGHESLTERIVDFGGVKCYKCNMRFWLLLLSLISFSASAGTLVQFRTLKGDIDVEMFDQDKPITVENFLRYVKAGAFKDMIMHRAVNNFVVQGGGFFVGNRGTTNSAIYYIPTYAPITNEFAVGKFYSNTYGTIAMAKTADPNSATSQFFFNLADNSGSLDNTNNSGGFTVFGRIVAGTNTLNSLNLGATNSAINLINIGGALSELPVYKPANQTNATYNDLVYVDVTTLNVQIRRTNNLPEISWNSISNKFNRVEFTTNFPPAWQLLIRTNGTGGTMKVSDTGTNTLRRFYRVQVEY